MKRWLSPLGGALILAWASVCHASGTTYTLVKHKVIDREGTGKLAFTYLLPKGWKAVDALKWLPQDYMTPVVGTTTITSPDGRIELDTMSGLESNYSHGPAGDSGVFPPRSVAAYLLGQWKRCHPNIEPEVVASTDTPVSSPSGTPSSIGRSYAVRGTLKLRYSQNGRTFLVKTQARIDVFHTNAAPTAIGGEMFEGGWTISDFFAVTAPQSQVTGAMKVLGIVLTSTRTDPHFFNTVAQAQRIISQNFYSMERSIMETSHIISQTNDAISDMIVGSYKKSQAAQDQEVTNFDDYVRGVQKYNDSSGTTDLPSGYAHAWKDDRGNYIVTDDHLYNPNAHGAGGTWHELEKSS